MAHLPPPTPSDGRRLKPCPASWPALTADRPPQRPQICGLRVGIDTGRFKLAPARLIKGIGMAGILLGFSLQGTSPRGVTRVGVWGEEGKGGGELIA